MPKWLSRMIQAGLPINSFNTAASLAESYEYESTRRQQPRGAGAGRRRRRHHAVELPAAPDRRQGRLRPGRRLHGRAQAQRGRAARRLHPRRGHRRRRPARRRVQPGHRHRPGGRRGHRRPSRRRHGVVHRLDPGRQAGGRGGVADRSSASPSSWAASRPTCCSTTSTTPTSRRPCATASARRYLNSGQTCTALTRMLVPADRLADAERIAADEVETKFQPERPVRRRRHARPAVSARPRSSGCTGYIQKGIDEGAKLVTGGAERARGPGARATSCSPPCSPRSATT